MYKIFTSALFFLGYINLISAQCPKLVFSSAYQPTIASGYTYSQGWNMNNTSVCDAINYYLKEYEYAIQVSDNGTNWITYDGEYNLEMGITSPSSQSDPFTILAGENEDIEVHFNFTQCEAGKHYKIFFDIYSNSNIALVPLPLGRLWTSFYVENTPPPVTVPNLTIYNLGAPSGTIAGNNINLTGIIENNGTAPIGINTDLEVWLSNNDILTSNDDLLSSHIVASINPNATSNINIIVTIPASTPAGTHYLCVVVDANDGVSEINENDNTICIPINVNLSSASLPNLVPGTINISSIVNEGSNVTASFRAKNESSNYMPFSSFTNKIYLSTNNNVLDVGDIEIASKNCSNDLNPGEADCYKYVSYANNLSPGTYWIIFCVNVTSSVSESNYDDNSVAIPFEVRVPCQFGGPNADFSMSASEIMEGQSINLNNNSNYATSYAWNIDNTSSSTNTNLNNTQLNNSGSADITLTAYDACGNDNTDTQYAKVRPDKTKPAPMDAKNGYKSQSGRDGDPVDMATGAFVTKLDFFTIDDITGSYPIAAYYTSTSNEHTKFGHKWTYSFDIRLEVQEKRFIAHWPDGHNDYYVRYLEDDSAEPLYNGITDTLYKNGVYIIEKPNGTEYKFFTGSQSTFYRIKDRYNNQIYLSHYSSGALKEVNFPSGRWVKYYYDSNDYITKIEANDGRTVHFTVDGATGNLVQYVNVKGDTMNITYDAAHNIKSQTDFKGTTILTNTYDTYNRVVLQKDAYDETFQIQYNTPVADATSIIDPANNTTIYYHDEHLRLYKMTDELGNSTTTSYDNYLHIPNGFTDELGNVSNIVFDDIGNPLHIINALDDSISTTYGAYNLPLNFKNLLGGITTFTRDVEGNPTAINLPNGSAISSTFNGDGQLTSYTTPNGYNYSIFYNFRGDIAELHTPSGIIYFNRDDAGRLLSITDRENKTVQFVWDEKNIIEIIDAKNVSSYASYDANDNLIYQVNRNSDTTFYSYDLRNRLVKIANALGEETDFVYNNLDLLVEVIDAKNNSVYYNYNARKELISSTNDLGTTYYDYNASGDLVSYTTAMGNTYLITYDALHRPVSTINPLGQVINNTIYNKASQPVSITDGSGYTTSFDYTNMGWLLKATDNVGGNNTMTLDNEGNILSLSDANEHTTNFTYNEFGQAVTQQSPEGRLTTITVNNEGYVIQVKRPDDSINSLAYDDNYNIVSSMFPTDTYFWGYNANDELITMANMHGTTSFELDALSRVTKTIDPFGNEVKKGFDEIGNNIHTIYPSGDTLITEFNSVGLATKVSDWLGNYSDRVYNADGLLTDIMNSNGTATQIGYDNASQIISYENLLPNSNILNQHNLTRLPGGNISQDASILPLQPNFPALTDAYSHNQDDEIQTTSNKEFTHNLNGAKTATTGSITENVTWGELDLVTEYTRNGITTNNKHNPLRQRIEKTVDSETTRYALDITSYLSQILEEQDPIGNIKATNFYAPDGLAWRIDDAGNASFYHFDYIGHTKGLTNSQGIATDLYAANPFGDYLNHSGNSTQPFIFEGKYGITHEGNSHYQVRAREYDASTGRFWSKDALSAGLGNTQSSAYIFGLNNPLSFVDVDGNQGISLNFSQNYTPSKTKNISFGNDLEKIFECNNHIESLNNTIQTFFSSGEFKGVSDKLVEALKIKEEFRSKVYDDDGGGNCTIGYGHLIRHSLCTKEDKKQYEHGISKQKANELLQTRLNYRIGVVNNALKKLRIIGVTQNQFDALVSFSFNGGGVNRLLTYNRDAVENGFYNISKDIDNDYLQWIGSNGQIVNGLLNRRKWELRIFHNNEY